MRTNPRPCTPLRQALRLTTVLLLGAAGCMPFGSQPECTLPQSKNLDRAFAEARNDLANEACQFRFDEYVDALLAAAAEDAGEENKRRFSELFAFARDQDILSARQAQRHYRRYFTPDFVSLSERYNNCSTTCRRPDEVRREMRRELRDKDRGLLRAADDQQGYAVADEEYNQLLTLIEATCSACQDP